MKTAGLLALLPLASLALAEPVPAPVPAARPDGPVPVSVRVEAGRPLGELRPIWRYFGADEPNYAYMKDGRALLGKLGELAPGQVYFRAHNLLTSGDGTAKLKWGSTGVYKEDADGRPVYDWTILDRIFDTYIACGVRPFVQIGFMPEALSTRPEPYGNRHFRGEWDAPDFRTGWSYPPKDYNKWRELVRQWALHCAERYGREEAESWRWEVWNEPNGYWSGTPEEWFKLYDYAVDGVRRALPKARVGGPHTAGGTGGPWLRDFLEHCRSGANAATGGTGSPLDFIGFHGKGRPTFVDGHVRMGPYNQLKVADEAFAVIADFPEFRHLPIIMGEADPDGKAARLAPELGYRGGAHYASYTAAVFPRLLELAEARGLHLHGVLTWAFEFEDQPYFAGYRVLSTNGIDLPILNFFRLLNHLGGKRLAVSSTASRTAAEIIAKGVRDGPDVSALASLDRRRLAVLLWHYHDDDLPGPDASVMLQLDGLPVAAGKGRLTQLRVDADHGNAFEAWKRMGAPQPPSAEQRRRLVEASGLDPVSPPALVGHPDGSLGLQLALPRQSVSVLVLDW